MSDWQDHCYLLHKRPFRDHYSWVYCLTKNHGVVTACIRETKKQKTGCEPLVVFGRYWCRGRETQILKFNKIELEQPAFNLVGLAALSGLYINELLYKTCLTADLGNIFQAYGLLLNQLVLGKNQLLIGLREFELSLIKELGYLLPFSDIGTAKYYHYNSQLGLVGTNYATNYSFAREHLLAIANKDWMQPGALVAARKLIKQVFQHILDGKTLASYAWFEEQS